MKNFESTKTKAKDVMLDDHFQLGNQLYRIFVITDPHHVQDKIRIMAHLIGGDDRFDDITVFIHPFAKFKIYNQSYKQK